MTFARILTCSVLALSTNLPAAMGQDTDPPCEQRLRESQEKLRQSENRVKDLTREIERLRKEASENKSGKDTKPSHAPVSSEPLSSPDALFEALSKDFADKVGAGPGETKVDQVKYVGAARKWTQDASRAFRGSVEWTIQVVKLDEGASMARPADVTFSVLDASGKSVGPPVTLSLPARFMKTLSEDVGKKTFKLTGTFGAKPIHNPQRTEKGAKDEPRFIGPYTEFGFDLSVQNIVAAK